MAINPQSVLSQLRMMSDQQLQQYAVMHKNDPFVFPLAFQESQTRKQMRDGAQMRQQPQAKVADQALAAMVPEDVGIGALPADNMKGMCGGGIVAFDEGGSVPRYNGATGAGSFVGPQYDFGAFLRQMGISTQDFLGAPATDQAQIRDMFNQTHGAPQSAAPGAATQAASRAPTMMERGIATIGNVASGAGNMLKRGVGAFSKYSPAAMVGEGLFNTSPEELAILRKADQERLGKATRDVLAQYGLDKGMPSPSATQADVDASLGNYAPVPAWASGQPDAPGAASGAQGAQKTPGGQGGKERPPPPADTGSGVRPGGGLGFTPGQGLGLGTRPGTYAAELEAMQPQGEVRSPFEAQIRSAGEAETKAAREYKELREQQMKDAGLAGIEQERRLKSREEKLAKTEGDVAGLAILKAGLAMMSGSSPFAMQNIGAGAQAGLEDYTKGREKIDAARERLDDAFDRLEQARRGELMLNQKEQAQLQRDVNKTIAQTEKDVLTGAREAYGWKKDDARAAFNAYVADRRTGAELMSRERLGLAQIAGQLEAARTTAGASGYLGLFKALGNGDVAKGMGIYSKAMGPEVRNDAASRQKAFHDWSTSPILQNQYKNFEDYFRMSGMGGPTIGGASGASTGNWGAATVVPQPGR